MNFELDTDTRMAVDCLIAMSKSQNDHTYVLTCEPFKTSEDQLLRTEEGVAEENQGHLDCQDVLSVTDNLNASIVARILADLKSIKQDNSYHEDFDLNVSETSSIEIAPITTTPILDKRLLDHALTKVNSIHGKKIHTCTHPGCGKSYNKSSHLKSHIRTHTGKSLMKLSSLLLPVTIFISRAIFFVWSLGQAWTVPVLIRIGFKNFICCYDVLVISYNFCVVNYDLTDYIFMTGEANHLSFLSGNVY